MFNLKVRITVENFPSGFRPAVNGYPIGESVPEKQARTLARDMGIVFMDIGCQVEVVNERRND